MQTFRLALVLILSGVVSPLVLAQTERMPDIVTDRPDETESAIVLPTGTVQAEFGFTTAADLRDTTDIRKEIQFGVPELLVRAGIFKSFELRVGLSYIVQNFTSDSAASVGSLPHFTSAHGVDNVLVGAKGELFRSRSEQTVIGVLTETILPIGSERISPNLVESSVRVTGYHDFQEFGPEASGTPYSLGYNVGVRWGDALESIEPFYSVSVGIGLLQSISSFLELAGNAPWSDPGDQSFNAGFSWVPSRQLQFDLAAGIGLTPAATDASITVGISFRVPK